MGTASLQERAAGGAAHKLTRPFVAKVLVLCTVLVAGGAWLSLESDPAGRLGSLFSNPENQPPPPSHIRPGTSGRLQGPRATHGGKVEGSPDGAASGLSGSIVVEWDEPKTMEEALAAALLPDSSVDPPQTRQKRYTGTPFKSDGKDPSLESVIAAGWALRKDNCCPMPRPGDEASVSRLEELVDVEKCPWWCLEASEATLSSPSRHLVYRASAKSGSSVTLVALTSILRVMHMELDYFIPPRNPDTYGLELRLNHDSRNAQIRNQFTKHAAIPFDFGQESEVLLSMRDPRDQVVSGYHHLMQGHSDNHSAPVHMPPDFCEPDSVAFKSSPYMRCDRALAASALFNVEALVRRDELQGLFPINFPTMVHRKLELLCRLADYMGFPWRKDEASFKRVLRGFEIIVEHLSPKTVAKQTANVPLNEGIHFRSGKARRGYMSELSKESLRFVDEFLCQHYPLALAIWGRTPGVDIDCDPHGHKWWDFENEPKGKRMF